MVEIKFIGTSSGKTSLNRYHSSFLINSNGFNLLIDAGDGISRALMNQKISFNFINAILISHLHPDHYSGLTSLIVQMKMYERNETLSVYCHETNSQFIKDFIYRSYLFEERLGFKINIHSFNQDEKIELSDGLKITARQNSHLDKNITQDNINKIGFSCSSFLINSGNKNILFTGDIGEKKDLFVFSEQKIDLMITEITHITPEELVDGFKRLNPQKLFITHLSEEDENKVKKLSYELPDEDRRKVVAAFDGLSVKF